MKKKKTEDIVKKIDFLTKKIVELTRVSSELKADVEELKSSGRAPAILSEEVVPSEWTKMSVQALQGADLSTLARTFESYKPTILALRYSKDGLTAEEISMRTGRSRQAEVTYLNRLHNAGVLSRERSKKKVIYKIASTSKLLSLVSK